jgi:hypothetical protein
MNGRRAWVARVTLDGPFPTYCIEILAFSATRAEAIVAESLNEEN